MDSSLDLYTYRVSCMVSGADKMDISPEALGFLSAVGVFVFLMILVFLYLNNKLSIENAAPQPHDLYRKSKDLPGE
ncbi:hypothetical protein NFI96_002366 [Prochilodus magdalenae]|nr:hypothetical protein NFI96_002366 [Prochilodus magdalenae]